MTPAPPAAGPFPRTGKSTATGTGAAASRKTAVFRRREATAAVPEASLSAMVRRAARGGTRGRTHG